jgi:glycerol-3-phosphate acyltransferase PlsX
MINLTLALDAMGGDHGPHVTVPAALQALKFHTSLNIILVGNQTEIEKYLPQAHSSDLSRIEIIHTTEVVTMCDKPIHALRSRKNSSMRIALELVRDGKAAACVSAGNTGALMAMAKVLLKTLPGIDRPALVSCLPAMTGKPVYLLDLGANVSCDSDTLFQFAIMGSVLCEAVHKKSRPKVALLNVGMKRLRATTRFNRPVKFYNIPSKLIILAL